MEHGFPPIGRITSLRDRNHTRKPLENRVAEKSRSLCLDFPTRCRVILTAPGRVKQEMANRNFL